jgi:DNA (cytosine-5)-methyltransferase 1
MSGLRYGSVCSGIEAATVAWHPLGWCPSFFSEIEAFPRAVLKHHWPEVPLHGDFTTIQAGEYEPIDLLVGGTPCQSFSVAGLRGGLDDDRGNLALEYLRLARRLRPRWLVWENVPGVLSSGGGRDFGAILGGMVELGYGFAYRVLDAQFFGVAQRRRRVFVVGHLGDWRRAAAVLFERHSLSGHPVPRREAGQRPTPTIAGGARRSGGYSEDDIPHVAHTLNAKGGAGRLDGESETFVADYAPALSRSNPYGDHESREGLLVAHSLRAEGFDASEDRTGGGTPLVPVYAPEKAATLVGRSSRGGGQPNSPGHNADQQIVAYGITRDALDRSGEGAAGDAAGRAGLGIAAELAQTIKAKGPGAVAFNITPSNSNKDYNARASDRAQAITGGGNRPSARGGDLIAGTVRSHTRPGSNEIGSIVQTSAVRRLTPRECERLQGFPDNYTLIPWRKGLAPDGPRYKALGNSMAVPVMSWVGRRIQVVEDLVKHGELHAA